MIYLIETTYYDKINKKIIDLLKIGYTNDLKKRFSQYVSCNPEVQLLDSRPGGENLEKYLHKYFSKYKYPKLDEWFYYNDEIIDDFQLIDLPTPEDIEELDLINKVRDSGIKYLNKIVNSVVNMYESRNYQFDLNIKSYKNRFNIIWENCVERIETVFKDENISEKDKAFYIMFTELNLQNNIDDKNRITNTVINTFKRNNEAGLYIASNNYNNYYYIISDDRVIKDELSYYIEINALNSVKEYFNNKYKNIVDMINGEEFATVKNIIEELNNPDIYGHSSILKFVLSIRNSYSETILNKLIFYIRYYKLGENTTTEISNYDSTKYFDMFPNGLLYYLPLNISDVEKVEEECKDCSHYKYLEELDKLVNIRNKERPYKFYETLNSTEGKEA